MKKLTTILLIVFISQLSFSQIDTLHEMSHVNSDPEQEKVMLLKLLNKARIDPQTYSKSIGVDLSRYKPMRNLVVDKELSINAQWYAEQLLKDAPVFEHSKMEYEESILWNYDVCVSIDQFIIDKNVPRLGHRRHLLDRTNTKVGIGLAKGYVGKWFRSYVVVLTD